MTTEIENNHKLQTLEHDFLDDGTVAVCTCGWRSKLCAEFNKDLEPFTALVMHKAHVREIQGKSQETR